MNLVGIANPNKVNSNGVDFLIRNWDGHDLKIFGNYLRTVNILKSRWGTSGDHYNLFNAGRSSYFSTIPDTKGAEYAEFLKNIKNFK